MPAFPSRRLVAVRFVRGVAAGDPEPDAPDIDERGFAEPLAGPVTSVAVGRTVKVGLIRVFLENSTPLFVESSDPSVVRVDDPAAPGQLPATGVMLIRFTGVSAGTDRRDALLRIRIGSADGPIIHQLHVVVFTIVSVRVTPHVVTIRGPKGGGTTPVADVAAIMKKVGDIWIAAGVTFAVQPVRTPTFTFVRVDDVLEDPLPGEVGALLANKLPDGSPNWVPNTINVFFVRQIGTKGVLGLGFSRSSFATFKLPNPGIVLGDQSAFGPRSGVMNFAQTLAHEFGHFFTLQHAGGAQIPNEREDTWSRRMLMHNFNPIRGRDPFPVKDGDGNPFSQRPQFNDIGYGPGNAGCLITLRNLAKVPDDAHMFTARRAILLPPGPF